MRAEKKEFSQFFSFVAGSWAFFLDTGVYWGYSEAVFAFEGGVVRSVFSPGCGSRKTGCSYVSGGLMTFAWDKIYGWGGSLSFIFRGGLTCPNCGRFALTLGGW